MKITVYGTGYVGLVSGACLANAGHQVLCVDIDTDKIDCLSSGGLPLYEPGLAEIVRSNAEAGRLSFSSSAAEGVAFGPLQFVADGRNIYDPDVFAAAGVLYYAVGRGASIREPRRRSQAAE